MVLQQPRRFSHIMNSTYKLQNILNSSLIVLYIQRLIIIYKSISKIFHVYKFGICNTVTTG